MTECHKTIPREIDEQPPRYSAGLLNRQEKIVSSFAEIDPTHFVPTGIA